MNTLSDKGRPGNTNRHGNGTSPAPAGADNRNTTLKLFTGTGEQPGEAQPAPQPVGPPSTSLSTRSQKYVAAAELAAHLEISPRTFREWRAAGRVLRPLKPYGRPRWLREDVQRWLEAGRPPASAWEVAEAERKRLNDNLARKPGQR